MIHFISVEIKSSVYHFQNFNEEIYLNISSKIFQQEFPAYDQNLVSRNIELDYVTEIRETHGCLVYNANLHFK